MFVENFDCDVSFQIKVLRLVYSAHAAATAQRVDLVFSCENGADQWIMIAVGRLLKRLVSGLHKSQPRCV